MADTKITALTALTAADPANDVIPIVDVSDTTMAASGTTKKISVNNILGASGTATLASATITGDLTVDTSTLKVDSTNNRVGIGTASPGKRCEINQSANAITTIGSGEILRLIGDDGNTNSRITEVGFGSGPTGATFAPVIVGAVNTSVAAYGTKDFYVATRAGTSDAAPLERYRIDSTGVATWSVAGTTAMTLNSTGLGVGVTPSAWGSGLKGLQIGSLGGASILGYSNAAEIGSNFYFDSVGYKYGATAASSLIQFTNGEFRFKTAASGTVGTAITFTQAMTLDASGNLMVGTTNNVVWNTTNQGCVVSSVALQASRSGDTALNLNRIASNGKTAAFARQGLEVGDISVTTTGTTFNSTSDYRLKEAVQPLVGGLARVNALKPSIYKWKSNGSDGEGFLAHELASVVSAAVTGEKDAVNADGSINAQSIDMSRVVPILVAAIQELTARVQTLEAR